MLTGYLAKFDADAAIYKSNGKDVYCKGINTHTENFNKIQQITHDVTVLCKTPLLQ